MSRVENKPEVEVTEAGNGVAKNGHADSEEPVFLKETKKGGAEVVDHEGDAEKNVEDDDEEEENVEEEEDDEEEPADEDEDEDEHEEEETGEESNGAPPAKEELKKKVNGALKHKLDDGQNGTAAKKAHGEVAEDAPEKTNGATAEAAAE